VASTIIDFLGNVLFSDNNAEPNVSPQRMSISEYAAQHAYAKAYQYRWIEVARHVAVGYIIAGLQMCPIRVTEAPGVHQPEAEYLWNVRPNPNQSRSEFLARLIDAMYFGRNNAALVVPVKRRGRYELWLADGWTENNLNRGVPRRYENISIDGSTEVVRRPLTADEVYIFKVSETSRWRALLSALGAVYDEMAKSAVEAFGDKNARRWLLELDASMSGTTDEQNAINDYLRDDVSSFVNGNDLALPIYKGMQIRRAEAENKDAGSMLDVLQIRQDAFRVVTSCMRIPYSFLEGNVNNFETVFNEFLTFCLDPPAQTIADEIAAKSLTYDQWARGGRVMVDTTHVRHVDLFAVADKVEKLVGASIDTPNEIREFTGQERVTGVPHMDEYQMTKNHEQAGEVKNDADTTSANAADNKQ